MGDSGFFAVGFDLKHPQKHIIGDEKEEKTNFFSDFFVFLKSVFPLFLTFTQIFGCIRIVPVRVRNAKKTAEKSILFLYT